MKAEIDLVDIGGGNIGSVSRCLKRLGVSFRQVDAANPPDGTRPLIVPGVGAFGPVMDSLRQSGLDKLLVDLVRAGTPYLGICVGMQVLFDGSEESPESRGLGLIPGHVVRFRTGKVPQIGWNEIAAKGAYVQETATTDRCTPRAMHGKGDGGFVYFVNSFYAHPEDGDCVMYSSNYGGEFCAAVSSGNITGFQFHPEKSGPFGETLIQRWIDNVSQ